MKKYKLKLLFLITFIAMPLKKTIAEDVSVEQANNNNPARVILVVNEDDCKKFMSDSNVTKSKKVPSADYVPGVDVYGNKVVTASSDVKDKLFPNQDILTLSFDPIAMQNINVDGVEAKDFNIGQVSLKDGTFMFNGEVLDSKAKELIMKACSDIIK